MLAQIINPLIGMALVITVARVKGAADFGSYTFALSMVMIFETVARLGIREYIIREINKTPERWQALLNCGVALGASAALVSQLAMLFFFRIVGYDGAIVHNMYIISFALASSVLYYVLESILFAFDRITVVGALSIGETIIRVGLSLLLLALGMGVNGMLIAYNISHLLVMLLAFVAIIKTLGKPARVWQPAIFRAMLKATPTFFTLAILASVYWRLDIMILSRLLGAEAVGEYSAAYRLMYLLVMVGDNVLSAAYPTMTRIFHHGRNNFSLMIEQAGKYLLMLYLPIALGVTLLSPKIVMLVFGEKFTAAVPALRVVIWIALPYMLNKLFTNGLVAANQQRLDLRVNLLRLLVSLSLHYLLITRFGMIGAAWALLAGCTSAVPLQLYYLRDFLRYKTVLANVCKPILAAALMTLGLMFTAIWPVVLQIVAGAAIYFAALFTLRPFDHEDRRLWQALGPQPTGETA
jgi:O-antigen/teichoic acid export membrane protein